MKINDLILNLQMDMKTYVLGVYATEGNLLENPIKSFKFKNVEAFIFESKNPEIEETIFAEATDASKKLYEDLKNMTFYFIVYIKDNITDELIVSEEIFYSSDEASAYAKKEIKTI